MSEELLLVKRQS